MKRKTVGLVARDYFHQQSQCCRVDPGVRGTCMAVHVWDICIAWITLLGEFVHWDRVASFTSPLVAPSMGIQAT